MNDEIQDIETLIKQSGELSDSLIRLARKLQERDRHRAQSREERAQNLATLHRKLTNLRSHIDLVNGTATPQEAVVELLRVGVADKTISPDSAVEQLAKLLRPDLPVSRRIEIRETAKAAFEAGDDVLGKVRPFLKETPQEVTAKQRASKTIAVTP
jgi:hypothetical protein